MSITYDKWAGQNIGKRDNQEDNYNTGSKTPIGEVFIVCDGMGGHAGGEVASKKAVDELLRFFSTQKPDCNIKEALNQAIINVNAIIYNHSQVAMNGANIGTTVCILIITNDGSVYYAHAGDSRIYIKEKNILHRLTKDQSYVQMLRDEKGISEAEAEKLAASERRRSQIMQAVGSAIEISPIICVKAAIPAAGATFLMCTDGLCGPVTDQEMIDLIIEEENKKSNLQTIGEKLINKALDNGGKDNITVSLIRVTAGTVTTSSFASVEATLANTNTNQAYQNAEKTSQKQNFPDLHNQTEFVQKPINNSTKKQIQNQSTGSNSNKLKYIIIGLVALLIIVVVAFLLNSDKKQEKGFIVKIYDGNPGKADNEVLFTFSELKDDDEATGKINTYLNETDIKTNRYAVKYELVKGEEVARDTTIMEKPVEQKDAKYVIKAMAGGKPVASEKPIYATDEKQAIRLAEDKSKRYARQPYLGEIVVSEIATNTEIQKFQYGYDKAKEDKIKKEEADRKRKVEEETELKKREENKTVEDVKKKEGEVEKVEPVKKIYTCKSKKDKPEQIAKELGISVDDFKKIYPQHKRENKPDSGKVYTYPKN